jgi:hypothetical protein
MQPTLFFVQILSQTTSASTDSVTITSTLGQLNTASGAPYAGTIYCAAFADTVTPTKTSQVVTRGTSTAFAAEQISVSVTISSGLMAVTTYQIYCYVSVSYLTFTLAQTLETKQDVTMPCCRTISFTSAPSYVASATVSSDTANNVFDFSLSSLPSAAIIITPYFSTADGIVIISSDSGLSISPSFTAFDSTSLSLASSFLVTVEDSATYSNVTLNLNVSGISAVNEYSTVLVNVTVGVVVSVLSIPAPTLSSVRVGPSGAAFFAIFDSRTDRAGLSGR